MMDFDRAVIVAYPAQNQDHGYPTIFLWKIYTFNTLF